MSSDLEKMKEDLKKSAATKNAQMRQMMKDIEAIATPEEMDRFPIKGDTGLMGDIEKLSIAFSILAKRIKQAEIDNAKAQIKTVQPKKVPKVK